MIDIMRAKKEFKNYIQNYDCHDYKIQLKIAHMYRVSESSKKIAENLKLSKEEIYLAELIGLLHDIGRFEQIKRYHTFNDSISINHGELGIQILFKDGLIRNFIKEENYDKIIYLAIINHNKNQSKLSKDVTEKEKLHMKIIRDSDTLDILYLNLKKETNNKELYGKEDISKDKLSNEIYLEFMENKELNYKNIKTAADTVVAKYMYIWNMNYAYSLKQVYDNRYVDILYDKYKFKDSDTETKLKNIYDETKQYLNEKLGI